MKKKLSLLLAIVMIVTTVMTAIPVITLPVIAADDTDGVTVYETVTTVNNGETVYSIGNVYEASDGTKVQNGNLADAYALVAKATADVTIKLSKNITKDLSWHQPTHTINVVIDGSDGNGGRYTFTNNKGNAFRMDSTGDLVFKDIILLAPAGGSSFVQARSKYMTVKFLNTEVYAKPGNHVVNVLADDLATSATVQGLIDAYNTANGTTYSAVMNVEIKNSTIINARTDNAAISFERNKNNHFFKADIENSTIIGGNFAIKVVDGANVDIDINNSTLVSPNGAAIDASGAGVKGSVAITGATRLLGKNGAVSNLDSDFTLTGTNIATAPLSINVGHEIGFVAAASWMTPYVSADAATGDNADFTINLTNDITLNLTYGASTFATPANAKVVVNGLKGTNGKYKITSTAYNVINHKVTTAKDLTFKDVAFVYDGTGSGDKGNFIQMYSGKITLKDCTVNTVGAIKWSWMALNTNDADSTNGTNITCVLENTVIKATGTDVNATGIIRADKAKGHTDIKLINSVIDASEHESRAIHAVATATVYMDAKSTVSSKTYPNSPISTAVKFDVLQAGGQKIYVAVENGEPTTYTSWNDAIVAMNAATDDVTVTLGSDVIIQYAGSDFSNGGREILNVNGKKITVDGQNKYGIIAVNATNTLRMGGNFEFKNMTISDNVKGSLFDMRKQSNLALDNVDFYGADNHEYTVICTLYDSNIATNVTLNNVTAQGYGNFNNNTIAFIRTGNPGTPGTNFVNIAMSNCDIDMGSAKNADGIIVTNATTANVTVINSKITSAGAGKAINVGTANPNAPIEGFGTATVINSVNSEISSVTSGAALEEISKEEVSPKMNDGASVRISTSDATQNGIRFTTVFTSEMLDTVATIADNTNFKFGTLITVTDAVDANGGEFDVDAIRALGWTVLDIPVTEGITVNEETGDTTIRAALINLKSNTREYSAVSYIEYTVNGMVCRMYSDYDETNNSRSMAEIAQYALNDLSSVRGGESGKHIYKTTVGGEVKYSPYTASQRAVLEGYLN